MLCPKPGTAPVTWQTAAMVFLHYRRANALPKISCRPKRPRSPLRGAARCGSARTDVRSNGQLYGLCGRDANRVRRALRTTGGAGGAEAEDVDDVCRLTETVLRRHIPGPDLHGIRLDLHGEAAVATDQVVVVLVGAAGAVQALPLRGLQGVRGARHGEVGERPIDRGETDRRPAGMQAGVQALRADEALGRVEGRAHGLALPGVPLHALHRIRARPRARIRWRA